MATEEFVDVDVDVDVAIPADDKKAPDAKPAADLKKDDVTVVQATEPAAKIIEPDEGIEILKKKLEDERTGRLAAEQRARQGDAEVVRAKTEVQDSNLQLITNAIETVKQSNEVLKGKYREARAAGDIEMEIEAQAAMQTNSARMLQLEQGKKALESQPKPSAPAHADVLEQVVSTMTPRSAAWVRAHPDFARDQRLYQKMIGAHNIAVGDGLRPDSDEYFQAIEETLKVNRPDPAVQQNAEDAGAAAAKVTQRRSSPAAAPVSRSGSGDGRNPNIVRLSPAEIEAARDSGLTPAEYARNKLALQGAGRMQ